MDQRQQAEHGPDGELSEVLITSQLGDGPDEGMAPLSPLHHLSLWSACGKEEER